jgi:hypothetical protein
MLADHFINFKGCNPATHSRHHDENHISMLEFIKLRERIFDQVPTLAEPDFAQDNRLPDEARNHGSDYMGDD